VLEHAGRVAKHTEAYAQQERSLQSRSVPAAPPNAQDLQPNAHPGDHSGRQHGCSCGVAIVVGLHDDRAPVQWRGAVGCKMSAAPRPHWQLETTASRSYLHLQVTWRQARERWREQQWKHGAACLLCVFGVAAAATCKYAVSSKSRAGVARHQSLTGGLASARMTSGFNSPIPSKPNRSSSRGAYSLRTVYMHQVCKRGRRAKQNTARPGWVPRARSTRCLETAPPGACRERPRQY